MIQIKVDRPQLEITRGESVTLWEYDVVLVKLECDRIEAKHNLIDGKTLKPVTAEALRDFAAYLDSQGLPGCDCDLAFRVYQLVRVQFTQLVAGLVSQIK